MNNDLHVFREGIKPLWEDPHNSDGGKLVLRLRKGLAARLWEHLLIATIDHKSPLYAIIDRNAHAGGAKKAAPIEPGKICGLVLSVRHQEDIISMWCKHGDERDAEPLRYRYFVAYMAHLYAYHCCCVGRHCLRRYACHRRRWSSSRHTMQALKIALVTAIQASIAHSSSATIQMSKIFPFYSSSLCSGINCYHRFLVSLPRALP